jgi:pilus assembly protein Flp/PilA
MQPRNFAAPRQSGKDTSEDGMSQFWGLLDRDERGQGLAEYALILALIAIVAIAALVFLGGQISAILSSIGQAL